MNAQEASALVSKLGELFDIAPSVQILVQTMLEKFPSFYKKADAEAVISRYAEGTATFDRGQLRTLLLEDRHRRAPNVSVTAKWKDEKEAEGKIIDEVLQTIPETRLRTLVDDTRKKLPVAFSLLPSDPLGTDVGRSLIYNEWKTQQCK